jgi:REP element-mobilizing transposase RayT
LIAKKELRPEGAPEKSVMPQSLAQLYVHLIFSTKNRERWLTPDIRPEVHAYMGGILNRHDCMPVEINSEPDHVHILFRLGRTIAVSEAVANVKKGTTDWLRARSPEFAGFYWQGGYGAFSVSQSGVEEVRAYIREQQEHHRRRTFQEEFLEFLRRYGVDYDERYLWD